MRNWRFNRQINTVLTSWAWIGLTWLIVGVASAASREKAPSFLQLDKNVRAYDARTPGRFGMYVKHLGSGAEYQYHAERRWYLASLVKVPLAIAVLQKVEEKKLSLADELVLQEIDYVDGEGEMLFQEVGTSHSISSLLKQSVRDSDSTATDMLMKKVGVMDFNQKIRSAMVAHGLGPFTTILQVRYDAYAELHPDAKKLSNLDFVKIRSAGNYDARVAMFQKRLGLKDDQLQASTLEEAFARYYQQGANTGTLVSVGVLLERLVRGELLNSKHTSLLLEHMEKISTGDARLKAGLPKNVSFAQKTGTQIQRACNMGVANPRSLDKAVVIVACVENFGEHEKAEALFQELAEFLTYDRWF